MEACDRHLVADFRKAKSTLPIEIGSNSGSIGDSYRSLAPYPGQNSDPGTSRTTARFPYVVSESIIRADADVPRHDRRCDETLEEPS